MYQYLLVFSAFVIVILTKMYLMKVSYKNKQNYYTNPMNLAKEVFASIQKSKTPMEFSQLTSIDSICKTIHYNIAQVSAISNKKTLSKIFTQTFYMKS